MNLLRTPSSPRTDSSPVVVVVPPASPPHAVAHLLGRVAAVAVAVAAAALVLAVAATGRIVGRVLAPGVQRLAVVRLDLRVQVRRARRLHVAVLLLKGATSAAEAGHLGVAAVGGREPRVVTRRVPPATCGWGW